MALRARRAAGRRPSTRSRGPRRWVRCPTARGTVAVVSAGTSDAPVAAEAALTVAVHGAAVERIDDVGVAGLHRLLAARDRFAGADCLVVVAGMEGALPSVVGGLTGVPLVAVPTSVGYGASFGGLAALLAMLNSCAPGRHGRQHRQRVRRGRLRGAGRPRGRGMTEARRRGSPGWTRPRAPAATCCSARSSAPGSRSACWPRRSTRSARSGDPAGARSRRGGIAATGARSPSSTAAPHRDLARRQRAARRGRAARGRPVAGPRRVRPPGRGRGRVHGVRGRRCTSTRSARWTRSPTWSALRRSGRTSVSTRCWPRRWRWAAARRAASTAPTRAGPAVLGCSRGAPVEGGPAPYEMCTPTGAALLATLSDAGARCRRCA